MCRRQDSASADWVTKGVAGEPSRLSLGVQVSLGPLGPRWRRSLSCGCRKLILRSDPAARPDFWAEGYRPGRVGKGQRTGHEGSSGAF